MTKEAEMLKTDPVYKWAQTRWPTYVEIALYIVDELVPIHGTFATTAHNHHTHHTHHTHPPARAPPMRTHGWCLCDL